MAKKKNYESTEGIDREIEVLRSLIRKASMKQSERMTLGELIELLDSVGKNALNLARMLKIRSDLANEELNPADLLRQALLELEDEWPEFKKACEKFPLYQEGSQN